MKETIFQDMIIMSFHRKTFVEKAWYFLKGLVFLPFLLKDSKKIKGKEDISVSISAAGEDIYPLF